MISTETEGEYRYFDNKPAHADMAQEVLAGLLRQPRHIQPKYFYDSRGSELFEQITELDEYYLTRTEMALFNAYLHEVAEVLGNQVCLIEYGSGSSRKIRKLLETITPRAYVPVDISAEHLQENARALHRDFPGLNVYPICADITQVFSLPEPTRSLDRVGFFPGSSIGNFEPRAAQAFLGNVHRTLGAEGTLLVGVDRKKSVEVLEAAYNDRNGVTAAFNLNLLAHLNTALRADFDLDGFEHVARYNEQEGCIQMFLRSTRMQQVTVAGQAFVFEAGECLHTENSYKYHPEEFTALAEQAGFAVQRQWSDERDWFSLYLLRGH